MDYNVLTCSVCHRSVTSEQYFCPSCGHGLKQKIIPIPYATQIGIYALSIFVPPLGLWPGIKYIKKPGRQARRVGLVAIILTVVSSIITVRYTFVLFQGYLDQINSVLN